MNPLLVPIAFPSLFSQTLAINYCLPQWTAMAGQGTEFIEELLRTFTGSVDMGLESSELPKRLFRLSLSLREHLFDHLVVGHGDSVSFANNSFLASRGHVRSELHVEKFVVHNDPWGAGQRCHGFFVFFKS